MERTNLHELNTKINDLYSNKVDKVEGQGLSSNNYTTEEKTKLAGLENYDDTTILADLETKVDKIAGKELSDNNFTDAERIKLAGLDNYDDTSLRNIVDTKVDKVEGKQLSTNDFTTEEKTKLASLENYDDTEIQEKLDTKSTLIKIDERFFDILIGDNTIEFPIDVITNLFGQITTDSQDIFIFKDTEKTVYVDCSVVTVDERFRLEWIYNNIYTNLLIVYADGAWYSTRVNTDINELVDNDTLIERLSLKQNTLVSGTNIKTINGTSLLGAGNVVISVDSNHQSLTNRDVADCHPISSITNLETTLNTKVNIVEGKQLSDNNYTTVEKTKLAGLSNYDDTALTARVTELEELYNRLTLYSVRLG